MRRIGLLLCFIATGSAFGGSVNGIEALTTLDKLVDPSHAAILVIDMQNENVLTDGHYYADEPGWDRNDPIPETPIISTHFEETHDIPQYVQFLGVARAAQVPVIYIEFVHLTFDQSAISLMYGPEMTPTTDPARWWSMTIDQLAPHAGDPIIFKHMGDSFPNTPLDRILRARGIKTLILTGTATNGCVLGTTWGGEQHNYYTVIVRDLVNHGTESQRANAQFGAPIEDPPDRAPGAYYERTLSFMATRYPVVTSEDVMALWRESAQTAKGDWEVYP